MALEPDPDPLSRARDVARTTEPEQWVELSSSIRGRIRALVPAGEPILVHEAPAGPDEAVSRTFVSSRVVVAAVRHLLQGAATHAPARIGTRVERDRLVGIDLELVCAYGVPIGPLADRVRVDVLGLLAQLLGSGSGPGPVVDLHVVDVTEGDPNLV